MSAENQNQGSVKEVIKQELVRCAQDPIYFMKKYFVIQHPIKGRMPFNLYAFQEKLLTLFYSRNEDIIINKSRQLGISTLVAAYSLWIMMFRRDTNILVVATKQDTAKNLVSKVSFGFEHLPSWLRSFVDGTEFHNKLSIKFNNGSQIKAVSAAGDSGRSEAVTLLIIDEAAFIQNIKEIYTSAQQTLATGGRCIALSTPFGTGNWFHQEFTKAEVGENKFLAIRLPWTVHPERNQDWRDEQDVKLGKREAAQECDCDFSTSGATVIEPEAIKWIETQLLPPIEKRYVDQCLWIWQYVDYAKNYAILVDVGRGDGGDFSSIQVVDIEEMEQVAEYRGEIDTSDLARLAVSLSVEYNMGILIIENTGVGWATVQVAKEMDYQHMYYSPRADIALTNVEMYLARYDKGDGMVPGFSTTTKSRPLVISKFTSYVNNRAIKIRSKRTHDEIKTFIWKDGKAQAQQGYNDDLVMPLGIGCFLRDTALRFIQTGRDLARAAMNSTTKSEAGFDLMPSSQLHLPHQQQWRMTDQHGNVEDLRWLLNK